MGVFSEYAKRRYEKEGAGLPAPERGIRRYFFLLGGHFWKLIAANLLFCAFSLPVVTLPAGLCGLNRVCIKLVREGNCFLWSDFFEEFKGSFKKSLPLGLLFGAGLFLGYYLLSLGLTNEGSLSGVLFSALGLAAAALSALFGSWTFVLVAMLPLGNADLLRNARALAALEGKRDVFIILTLLAAAAFVLLLFPYSLLFVLVILCAIVQFTLCFFINTPVQARIVAPYEALQAAKEADAL